MLMPPVPSVDLELVLSSLQPPVGKFDEEALVRLNKKLLQLLPQVYALGKSEIINCSRSGLTIAIVPPAAAIALKLLLPPSDDGNTWGVKRVVLDREGRFVVNYALENAWSEDFEYQRAFVRESLQPTLKITGIRATIESALQDYIGAKGLAEETSAPAPLVARRTQASVSPPITPQVLMNAAPGADVETLVDKIRKRKYLNLALHLLIDASSSNEPVDENTKAACEVLIHLMSAPAAALQLKSTDFWGNQNAPTRVNWIEVLKRINAKASLSHVEKSLNDAYFDALLIPMGPAMELESISSGSDMPRAAGGEDKETSISKPALLAASSDDEDPATRAIRKGFEKLTAGAMNRVLVAEEAPPAGAPSTTTGAAAKEDEKAAEAPAPPPPPAFASQDDSPHLRGSAVRADVANNSVLVVAPRFDAKSMLGFMAFLDQLIVNYDQGRKMVEISVAIVDMDTTVAEEWGTRFAVASNGHIDDYPAFGVGGFRVPVPAPGKKGSFSEILNPTAGVPQIPTSTVESVALSEGLNVGALLVGSSTQFLATLHALERDGRGQVLSRPSVLTVDNSEAILAEETKFYLPATGLNTGTLAEVPTGLRIAVTPQIVCLGEESHKRPAVRMRILVKEGTGSNTKKNPAGIAVVDNSQFKTVAVIEQGQSLMVAGRLRHEETSGDERVPILGRIPIVSRAFKNANTSKSRQQRVVLITPSIVDQDTYHSEAAAEAGNLFREPELPRAKPLPSRGK
jgi:type II secretory pathway component GspD/PulD (secretin)